MVKRESLLRDMHSIHRNNVSVNYRSPFLTLDSPTDAFAIDNEVIQVLERIIQRNEKEIISITDVLTTP